MSQDEEILVSPTKEKSKSIQAIDREAVHRICSGQVVLNLATAVKELVENSLDAGATSIEIRLREYGSELVEVVDNGCGVEEANFEGLTLKHHTSKLREFTDLLGVETFGFRGEALSSLCALSDLTVTTRHSSSNMGTKLIYDSRGHIIRKSPCARQVGTTVSLANLFSPLPVRQKEFLRNLKREFVRMSQLLHAYCLISTGVKILCSNQTKKGGKSVVVSTQGSNAFKGNIMCIFGAKQANSLLDIEVEIPSASNLEEIGLSNDIKELGGFELEGCISSCAHGQGRSSTDRQFYYINNRPCDPTKVSKVVNEVYHHFNIHQFPFVFLNIKTARESVDVNVTPDKRQIFLDNEKLLVATVKASLLKLFEKIPNTYQVQNAAIGPSKCPPSDNGPSNSATPSPNNKSSCKISNFSSLLKSFSHSNSRSEADQDLASPKGENSSARRGLKRPNCYENNDGSGKKQLCLTGFVSYESKSSVMRTSPDHCAVVTSSGQTDSFEIESKNDSIKPTEETLDDGLVEDDNLNSSVVTTHYSTEDSGLQLTDNNSTIKLDELCDKMENSPVSDLNKASVSEYTSSDKVNGITETLLPILNDSNVKKPSGRRTITINMNMSKLKNLFHKFKVNNEKGVETSLNGKPRVRFYAEIDPTKNKSAEQELNKEISKDMFSKMDIIGQFNLGFIITKLGHDLFIVDQHATDEKYNFETLQAHTTLKNQKLVIPQTLDLTAVNECILMDNLDIFTRNGFTFQIDKEADPTKRVRLAAKPISHNWEFGKEDIDELLFMLQDSPHTMCRPSRVRAMFASRACRKSVMIGTALSKSTMRQLVDHMGEIEQPWNCPHGRPTMRHLVNLELIRKRK